MTLALTLLAVVASPANAADANGNYAIWGAGGRSCHQFQRSHGSADLRQPFKDFLMGYMTAYNAVVADTYNALGEGNLEAALVWLGDYCELHKIDSFDRALTQLLISKHPTRLRTPGGNRDSWGRAPGPTSLQTPDSARAGE